MNIDAFIKEKLVAVGNDLTPEEILTWLEKSNQGKTLLMREVLGGRFYSVDGGDTFHKSIKIAITETMK